MGPDVQYRLQGTDIWIVGAFLVAPGVIGLWSLATLPEGRILQGRKLGRCPRMWPSCDPGIPLVGFLFLGVG